MKGTDGSSLFFTKLAKEHYTKSYPFHSPLKFVSSGFIFFISPKYRYVSQMRPWFPHQTTVARPASPLLTLFYVFYSFYSSYFNHFIIIVGAICPCVVSSNIARFYLKSVQETSPKLTKLYQINRQFVSQQQLNFSTHLVKCKAYRFSHRGLESYFIVVS